MTNPLVSICIPTYNGKQFIAEAMESAINQTYSNLEIIVSDDASKDSTVKIIESYKNKTTIPITIYPHQPKSIGANWNYCIKKARGDYIKFLFQDDVLMPACIEEMVKVLEINDSVKIVASKRNFIVEDSFLSEDSKRWIEVYGDLQQTLSLHENKGLILLDKQLFSSEEFFRSPLNMVGEPSTILFRKNLVNEIGYFREDLKQVLDYEFCYRVLKQHKIAIINTVMVKFRLHGLQTTVINKGNDSYAVDYDIYERIIYDEYSKYLSSNMRKSLMRKYNKWVHMFYSSIDILKSVFR